MNKKHLLFAGLGLAILVLAYLVFSDSSSDKGGFDGSAGNVDAPLASLGPENDIVSFKYPQFVVQQAMSLFDSDHLPSYDQILQMARRGEISLVSELWRLRRKCPKTLSPDECTERIRAFLASKFPEPDNQQIVALYDKYLNYERTLREYQFDSNLTLDQRFEIIKQKRREILGEDMAQLIFGFDEARVSYNQQMPDFLKEVKGLSGDEKVRRYEEMRKEVYGDYYETMVKREPKFNKYETETSLRQGDWQKLDDPSRSAQVTALREKYFGKEGAERMAAVDQKLAQEKANVATYEKAESDFLKTTSGLTEAQKEAKLKEMRVKMLGPDEAEAYERRQKYQQYLESKKKK